MTMDTPDDDIPFALADARARLAERARTSSVGGSAIELDTLLLRLALPDAGGVQCVASGATQLEWPLEERLREAFSLLDRLEELEVTRVSPARDVVDAPTRAVLTALQSLAHATAASSAVSSLLLAELRVLGEDQAAYQRESLEFLRRIADSADITDITDITDEETLR